MKPIHTVLVIVIAAFSFAMANAQSGWVLQPSGTGECFWGISFAGVNTGAAVGNNGSIFRTTDGGMTWVSQSRGTGEQLFGVRFVDANIGTAVGRSGVILRTTDGGASWALQSSNTMDNINAVSFKDSSAGMVVGDNGAILRTTNGGTTWTKQSSGTINALRGVRFVDDNIGIAVGDGGTILRTTDGGTSWATKLSGTGDRLYGVDFGDAKNGLVVGGTFNVGDMGGASCSILRTTDGGETWTPRSSPTNKGLSAVFFADAHTAFAAGARFGKDETIHSGFIIRTTDSGKSWTMSIDTTDILTGVSFRDSHTGAAVGFWGTILRTTNSGITWVEGEQQSRVPQQYFLSQNYPNPFNPSTTIKFELPRASQANLTMFDILGREVSVLVNEKRDAGVHEVKFDGSNLASGVYFYRLQAGDFVATKRLLLLR